MGRGPRRARQFPPTEAEQTETGMVPGGLAAHTAVTRLNTALRYRDHLQARETAGETVTAAEWDCFAELTARARAAAAPEQRPGDSGAS